MHPKYYEDFIPQVGEIVYVKDTESMWIYVDNQWMPLCDNKNNDLIFDIDEMKDVHNNEIQMLKRSVKVDNDMNLYEMNQNMVKQLPVLDITEKELNLINQLHNIHGNQYYMLLCNDMKYYTILKASSTWAIMPTMCETLGLTVVDCLKSIGNIKSIDLVPDNSAIEIWLENAEGVYCMYLFPYNEGVVEFRG